MRALHRQHKDDGRSLSDKFAKLSSLIEESNDFSAISDYFHEQLVPAAGFVAAGVHRENPRLWTMCRLLLRAIGADTSGDGLWLIHVPTVGFWHGAMLREDGSLLVNYFETINRGLASCMKSLANPRVDYFRFAIPDDLTTDIDLDTLTLASMSRRPPGGYAPV